MELIKAVAAQAESPAPMAHIKAIAAQAESPAPMARSKSARMKARKRSKKAAASDLARSSATETDCFLAAGADGGGVVAEDGCQDPASPCRARAHRQASWHAGTRRSVPNARQLSRRRLVQSFTALSIFMQLLLSTMPSEPVEDNSSGVAAANDAIAALWHTVPDGYTMQPSPFAMCERASREPQLLQRVPDFAISRPGFGNITWLDPIDVTGGIDVEAMVDISHGHVVVYPDSGPRAPWVGRGLNGRARIQLVAIDQLLPGNWDAVFEQLQLYCVRVGATFLSYSHDGTWEFEVEHFSECAASSPTCGVDPALSGGLESDPPGHARLFYLFLPKIVVGFCSSICR